MKSGKSTDKEDATGIGRGESERVDINRQQQGGGSRDKVKE